MEKHEKDGTTDSPEYQAAIAEFFKSFVMRVDPWPAEFVHTLEMEEKDTTVYYTMCVLSFHRSFDVLRG